MPRLSTLILSQCQQHDNMVPEYNCIGFRGRDIWRKLYQNRGIEGRERNKQRHRMLLTDMSLVSQHTHRTLMIQANTPFIVTYLLPLTKDMSPRLFSK